jgi:hypothetical protein
MSARKRLALSASVVLLSGLLSASAFAARRPPPTLTGEALWTRLLNGQGVGSIDSPNLCEVPTGRPAVFSASGLTRFSPLDSSGTEPYPGTYGLNGVISLGPVIVDVPEHEWHRAVLLLATSFHIDSDRAQVNGRSWTTGAGGTVACNPVSFGVQPLEVRYTTTIRPSTGGAYADRGHGTVAFSVGHRGATFAHTFASSLNRPSMDAPGAPADVSARATSRIVNPSVKTSSNTH